MALKKMYIDFIESNIKKVFDSTNGRNMLELGNQKIKKKQGYIESTGKEYFSNIGYNHVSVDLNGFSGALVKDLRNPNDFKEWQDFFDVLTNSGTTEHVEPFETQYDCYKILHDVVKPGGVFVHLIPDVVERDTNGAWLNHCYFYYSKEFFDMLAKECNYKLLDNTIIDNLRCAALQKQNDSPFMTDKSLFLSHIEQRNLVK